MTTPTHRIILTVTGNTDYIRRWVNGLNGVPDQYRDLTASGSAMSLTIDHAELDTTPEPEPAQGTTHLILGLLARNLELAARQELEAPTAQAQCCTGDTHDCPNQYAIGLQAAADELHRAAEQLALSTDANKET